MRALIAKIFWAHPKAKSPLFNTLLRWYTKVRKSLMGHAKTDPIHVDPGWKPSSQNPVHFQEWNGGEGHPPSRPSAFSSALGNHLLVEFYGCDEKVLMRTDSIQKAMEEAVRESKASVVQSSFHEFKPYGVSGVVVIQESHYTIHTWPEWQYAAIDLFFCSEAVQVEKAVHVLQKHLKPQRITYILVERGKKQELQPPSHKLFAP